MLSVLRLLNRSILVGGGEEWSTEKLYVSFVSGNATYSTDV